MKPLTFFNDGMYGMPLNEDERRRKTNFFIVYKYYSARITASVFGCAQNARLSKQISKENTEDAPTKQIIVKYHQKVAPRPDHLRPKYLYQSISN